MVVIVKENWSLIDLPATKKGLNEWNKYMLQSVKDDSQLQGQPAEALLTFRTEQRQKRNERNDR